MIVGLDSATPPTLAQAQAAKAAGVAMWSGYIATRGGLGLLRPWTRAEFAVVQQVFGGQPIAFCSGWDDPAAVRDLAASWGVRLCVDVENGIRDDGPWVDGFIAASGAGLYGLQSVHYHPAPFRVAAGYPTSGDPLGVTWPGGKGGSPSEPHGWQWAGSHMEFGVEVDRGDYDDWFNPTQGGDDLTGEEHNALMEMKDKLDQLWADYVQGPRNANALPAEFASLQGTEDKVNQLWTDLVLGPRSTGRVPDELKPLADAMTSVKAELDALKAAPAPDAGTLAIVQRIEAALKQA